MKVFLKCTHDVDDADPKLLDQGKNLPFSVPRKIPEDDEKWFYPCWICTPATFVIVDKIGNSEADQATHTSRLAQ